MALRAIVSESRVRRGNFPRVEKRFMAALLKNDDGDDTADNRDPACPQPRSPPRMQSAVVAEVAFVALGDLFLRATRRGHGGRLVNLPRQ